MKKKKFIPLLIVFLLLSVAVITVGLYYANALPERVMFAVNNIVNSFQSDKTQPVQNTDTPYIQYTATDRAAMPQDMHAVWFSIADDLQKTGAETYSYGEFLNETAAYFNDFKNYTTDTVFIVPDTQGRYDGFSDAYGNIVDVLREIVKYADANGLYKVLVADESCIYNDGNLSFDKIQYYVSNYSFSAVLLSVPPEKLGECADFTADRLRKTFGMAIGFGIDVPVSVPAGSDQITNILAKGSVDFAVIEGASMASAAAPFAASFSRWNQTAGVYPGVTFYCKHRNDLVCSNGSEWSSSLEICNQFRYLWDCENFSGSVFYGVYALKRNRNTSSLQLSHLIFDGAYDDLAVATINLDQENGVVAFSGTGSAGHKIMCNKKVIGTNGAFSITSGLNAGENVFRFFSCGKELTYRVYNNTKIIYAFYPQENVNTMSGETVYVSATCMTGSEVNCHINGKTYKMSRYNAISSDDIPTGYEVYSCGIRFSGNEHSDTDLGSVVISATLGQSTETVTGARITVLKSAPENIFSRIIGYFSSDKTNAPAGLVPYADVGAISPYHDNGLGTALLCRIVNDDTEQLGILGEKDTYHADYSTLPEGTIDYVIGMTLNEKGYLRYELASGISVYGVNCELINNGFILPGNRVAVNRVDDSSPKCTDIYFDMDWFSPITVKCCPQKYYAGYSSYSFNISSFTAEYVDVKFHHAKDFYNSALLTFDASSVFSRSELYAEGEDNLILRLYLKKTGQFYGFDIYKNERNQTVISFKKHVTGSLQGKTVFVDAGHGGLSMTGTALSDNSMAEKQVTLAIALKAKSMLEAKGAEVIMSRYMDTPLTLEERGAMLTETNPDVFISIHCDGADNPDDAGTHTFYFRPYSQPLAEAINSELAAVYKTYIYSPTDSNYGRVDKSIKFYPFYVTRMNQCPAVLIETGFMTNPIEGRILSEENTQYWLAYGITNGIEKYFASNY